MGDNQYFMYQKQKLDAACVLLERADSYIDKKKKEAIQDRIKSYIRNKLTILISLT